MEVALIRVPRIVARGADRSTSHANPCRTCLVLPVWAEFSYLPDSDWVAIVLPVMRVGSSKAVRSARRKAPQLAAGIRV
jgi:hypothetical protein